MIKLLLGVIVGFLIFFFSVWFGGRKAVKKVVSTLLAISAIMEINLRNFFQLFRFLFEY